MLARHHGMNARAVHIAILRPSCAPRRLNERTCVAASRAFHKATAELTNLGPEGTLVKEEIPIRVGEPKEAYVCVPTEVGYALQAAGSRLSNGSSSARSKRPDRVPLTYFHDTQHFALGRCPALSTICCCY
jgi:hypothetical protein